MQLQIVVPTDRSDTITDRLRDDPRVTNVVRFDRVALRPEGDFVQCDIAREAVSDVLDWLHTNGIDEDGSVSLIEVDSSPSPNAWAAEKAAPGAPDDAIVWDAVLDTAWTQAKGSWSFYAFLTVACMIAAVAVVTDSPILVVGAMVVGPEFGVIAAFAVAVVLGKRRLAWRSAYLLFRGFLVALIITISFALILRSIGWISPASLSGPRPLTGFIWQPNHWSLVVALLAGAAGVLSQTAGHSNALVGVFISVTTIPAVGEFSLSVAVWAPKHLSGSAQQLGINLLGMTVAGVVTLAFQRLISRRNERRRAATTSYAEPPAD
ncbi:DUF389 domain-containing protein [Antricoccus suffuscus]|nr:DUF389 domain-containing protein [Antricoccus suffuscus]